MHKMQFTTTEEKILQKVIVAYTENIIQGSFNNHQDFLDLFRICTSQKDIDSSVINGFIEGLGEIFESLTTHQLLHFTNSLTLAGLQMDDVFSAVIERLEKSDTYYQETFYLMQNQLLTLGLGQSELYSKFIQSCEAHYGRPMSELVVDLMDMQKVDLA